MKTNFLTAKEAAEFLGVKMSYLYKLTHNHVLPYTKPRGGKIYFCVDDLQAHLNGNHIASNEELEERANEVLKGGAK